MFNVLCRKLKKRECLFPSIDGVPISRHYRAILRIDLIALDGEDLRRWPIEDRKRKLAKLVRGPHPGIVLNGFFEVGVHISSALLQRMFHQIANSLSRVY